MNIKDNAKKGIYSTVVGSVIIVSAIVSVFVLDEVKWSDAMVAIGAGLALIGLVKK